MQRLQALFPSSDQLHLRTIEIALLNSQLAQHDQFQLHVHHLKLCRLLLSQVLHL
jgi:hypothetical protein